MYFNRKCKITFICHGATIYSEEGRFSDADNYPPLSESGVDEMKNIISYLKKRGVKNDAIYTSPSLRTLQSATMVSKLFKTDYEVLEDLTPRECGQWNGMTFSQILDKYPTGLKDMIDYPEEKTQAGGESGVEFVNRIKVVIDKLVNENIGNRIIIVTHPDVIQAAICAALDINAGKLNKIYIRTGSATQISYFENWASLVYSDHVPI
jgi:broad specificity phosphatase PhoE